MRTSFVLSCLLCTSLGGQIVAAQTPATQPPAAQTPPAPAAPAARPPVKRRPPAAAVTVTITVTDGKGGEPIGGVKVTATMEGTEKDAQTTAGGIARFLSVKPGEYRLRFEHENYIPLERDIVVKGTALDLTVPLSPAPAPPPKPAEPPATSTNNAAPGEARALSVVDFLESNHLSGHDPSRSDQLGCTASAKTTLIQVRDSIDEKSQPDADEVLYVIAGEGTLRLGNKEASLQAGGLAVVPRGTVRGLTRKGKNPLMLLSIVSGPACTGMTNSK